MSFAAAAGLMTACETDLETVSILPLEEVTAPVFHDLGVDEIAFTASNQTEKLAFSWDAADFGKGALVTYSIEASIPEISKQIVQGIAATSAELAYEDLNKALALSIEDGGMGIAPDAPADVELRIGAWVGNVVVYSEAQTVRFSVTTAEKSFPMVYMPGSYCDWSHTASQNLYDFAGDGKFTGIVDFGKAEDTGRSWKFTPEPNWENDWGVDSEVVPDQSAMLEANELPLKYGHETGSANIMIYQKNRYYHLTLDSKANVVSKNYSFDQIGIVGDFNGWGEDVVMTFNAAKRRFYADVENLSGGFKFRADADWALNWGGADGVAVAGGDNIAVEEAGNYRVYLYISDPNDLRYELNAKMYGTEGDGVVETPEDPKPEVEKGGKIIYVNNEDGWDATYLYTWNAVDGGEGTGLTNTWPGKEMTLTTTQNGKTYVGYEMPESTNGFSIKYIFNNNAGTQTGDSEAITLDRNYYFTLKNGVATEDAVEEVTYKLYADVSATGWTNVNAWVWDADGQNYTGGSWPGQALASVEKDGKTYWVFEAPASVTGKTIAAIFNNGAEQTVNIEGIVMDMDHTIILTEKNADGNWLATLDGTEAPEPVIPEVALADHTWGVIGVNGAWNPGDDKAMTIENGWAVATVTFNADNSEFKVRADGNWDISYGVSDEALTTDGEPFAVGYNAGNLVMPTAGTYDIYFTVNGQVGSMKIVAATGTTPDPTPDPEPAAKKIYLKPGPWPSDSARIEVYFFVDDTKYTWETMTASSTSGVLECNVPEGYPKMIFVRMDPKKPEHDWGAKWNQSGDLTLPTGDKNCYVMTDANAWDQNKLNDSLWTTL